MHIATEEDFRAVFLQSQPIHTIRYLLALQQEFSDTPHPMFVHSKVLCEPKQAVKMALIVEPVSHSIQVTGKPHYWPFSLLKRWFG